MVDPLRHRPRRVRRQLATSTAVLAFALALGTGAARAQSYIASATVTSGPATGNVTNPTGTTTVISVTSPEVVIDWKASGSASTSPFVFQNALTTATFANPVGAGPALAGFTVLNRVSIVDPNSGAVVARPIQFDGTTTSSLNGKVGGNIWFYNPDGIIVGGGAQFTVGSLVLTTDAIDTTGGLYGAGNTIRFRGAAGATGAITISGKATIDATQLGSGEYVALVAPRVVQGGTINTAGSTALVAAEQADLSINAGLFTITVTQGTTDPNGIVHTGTGTTSGPATASAATPQVLSLVAIPKNTALTMLLSGQLGYTAAASAAQEGSSIVLASGVAPNIPAATQALGLGNMTIGNALFSNAVTGNASGTIAITPTSLTQFSGDAAFTGGKAVSAIAGSGAEIRGLTNLTLNSGLFEAGGAVTVRALDPSGSAPGLIDVANTFAISAAGFADPALPPFAYSPAAFGGTVIVSAANRAQITAPTITIDAGARTGAAFNTGGIAVGGTATLTVTSGGSITSQAVTASTTAIGGSGNATSGDATGGSLVLRDTGGNFQFGTVALDSSAFGGVPPAAGAMGGSANGGTVTIDIQGATAGWSSLAATANATVGAPFVAGAFAGASAIANPNAVSFHVGNGASFALPLPALLSANGYGAVNGNFTPGTVRGGGISVVVDSTGTLTSGGRVGANGAIEASAQGLIDQQSFTPLANNSPNTVGGTISVMANSGTIALDHLTLDASAIGAGVNGAGAVAGSATGGSASVSTTGGTITIAAAALGSPTNPTGAGNLFIIAQGLGGQGTAPASAQGGSASLSTSYGFITVAGQTTLDAGAKGGAFDLLNPGGTGFNATGGIASVTTGTYGLGTTGLNALLIDASGDATGAFNTVTNASNPILGDGGTGRGGTASLALDRDGFTAASAQVNANGIGGNSAADVVQHTSGSGFGGASNLTVTRGTPTVAGAINLVAQGQGGSGAGPAGPGQLVALSGNGTGGNATASLASGTLNAGSLTIDAQGRGANGMADATGLGGATGAAGGQGTGGRATLAMPAASSANLVVGGAVLIDADATGGNGGSSGNGAGFSGSGGSGAGGQASVALGDGAFQLGATTITANGTGGTGPTIGGVPSAEASTGGGAGFALVDTVTSPVGRQLQSLSLRATGTGFTAPGPSTSLTVTTLTPGSGLTIAGPLDIQAFTGLAGDNSFVGTVTGAPLTVGGSLNLAASGAVGWTIAPGSLLDVGGPLAITSLGAITTTGLIRTAGDALVTGQGGVSLSDLQVGGTTTLGAANGALAVTNNLISAGLVSATGRSVAIVSAGPLSFATASATAGDLSIRTAGALALAGGDATGAVTLTSTGGSLTTTGPVTSGAAMTLNAATTLTTAALTSGGGLTASAPGNIALGGAVGAAGAVTLTSTGGALTATAPIQSGGNLALSGATGIATPTVTSGGTTSLSASGGAIDVGTALSSTGLVDAQGQTVNLVSPGSLSFASLVASAGDATVRTGGDLGLGAASAPTTLLLAAGGALHATGVLTAHDLILGAGGALTLDQGLTAPGTIQLGSGGAMVASGDLNAGGQITVNGGATTLRNITSAAGIHINAGALSTGAIQAGTWVEVQGAGTVTLGNVTAGNDVQIVEAADADLTLGNVTAGDDVFLSLFGTQPPGAPSATRLTAGNVIVTGLGNDTAPGDPNGRFSGIYPNAAGPAGNVTRIRSAGSIQLGTVQTPGQAILVAHSGTTSATALDGGTGAWVFGSGPVTLGSVQTGGRFFVADQSMFLPLVPPGYAPSALDGQAPVRMAGALTVNGPVQAASVTVATGGATTTGALTATSGVSIDSTAGLALGATDAGSGTLALNSAGPVTASGALRGGAGVTLDTRGTATLGAVSSGAGGAISLTADAGLAAATINSGGPTALSAVAGPVAIGALTSTGLVTVLGQSVNLVAPGALRLASATATGGDLSILTAGDLAAGAVAAGGTVTLTSSGGALTSTGTIDGGAVALSAKGAITQTAPGAQVLSRGALTATSGGDLTLAGGGSAGGALALSSSGGAITAGQFSAASIDLRAPGGIQIDAARSRGALTVNTGGLFRIRGASTGTTIAVTSADIDLGTFSLGDLATTQSITLTTANPLARTFIGGPDQAGGFSLSGIEVGQLFASRAIRIVVPAPAAGALADLVLDALGLTFGKNLGAGGTFELTTPGRVAVIGPVSITTSGAGDTVTIDPTRIDVITDKGGIALLSAAGAPLGQLNLTAGTIAVANAATLTSLNGLSSLPAINALLDAPAATANPAGSLVAGAMNLNVTNGLLIQNAGTSSAFPARRGFTAGSLAITTASTATALSINGLTLGGGGIGVTGLATAPTILINGVAAVTTGKFAAFSAINGCVIGFNCGFVPGLTPTDGTITQPLATGSDGVVIATLPLVQLEERPQPDGRPLIDEPVTGIGNDDLWGRAGCISGSACPQEGGKQ